MAETPPEGRFEEEKPQETITDADFALAEIGNFLENGIHPLSRGPFTLDALREVLEEDKKSPPIASAAFMEAIRRLKELGILGHHNETDEYYLKNLA